MRKTILLAGVLGAFWATGSTYAQAPTNPAISSQADAIVWRGAKWGMTRDQIFTMFQHEGAKKRAAYVDHFSGQKVSPYIELQYPIFGQEFNVFFSFDEGGLSSISLWSAQLDSDLVDRIMTAMVKKYGNPDHTKSFVAKDGNNHLLDSVKTLWMTEEYSLQINHFVDEQTGEICLRFDYQKSALGF